MIQHTSNSVNFNYRQKPWLLDPPEKSPPPDEPFDLGEYVLVRLPSTVSSMLTSPMLLILLKSSCLETFSSRYKYGHKVHQQTQNQSQNPIGNIFHIVGSILIVQHRPYFPEALTGTGIILFPGGQGIYNVHYGVPFGPSRSSSPVEVLKVSFRLPMSI